MSKYIYISLFFLSMFAVQSNVKAQIDSTFWFAAPWVTPDHAANQPMAFHFSTFNKATTIRLRQPASTYDTTFVVPANALFSKYVTHLLDSLESKPADSVINRGFNITADTLITVVYDFLSTGNNPETFSLKGQNGMGFEFVTPFQTLWDNQLLNDDRNGDNDTTQPKQFFSIVSTEDNTTIYITPKAPVMGGHPADVTYSVFLPKAGQVYTCENLVQTTSNPGSSLAGSIVVADKKISVTVTDDSVNPSGGGGCYDLMGDQIVPTDVIGTNYIVNKGFLNLGSDESIFVLATENFTSISIDNGLTITTAILNQGDTYQYSITEQLTYVESDKNVYLLHMSGYGCELGQALIPPLNCAGSDQISFPRTNNQSFLMNILVPAGSENDFLLNGNPALIQGPEFNPVPGLPGWLGAQISDTITGLPVGSANILTNSSALFSLGIINGTATGGCLYHYLSSFLRRIDVDAGLDLILCDEETTIDLSGSVKGGATTGSWSVVSGTGTLNSPSNLLTTYNASTSDLNQGSLTFVLTSAGICDPVRDTMEVTFKRSPIVTSGPDDLYCKNNIGSIPVTSTLQFAAGSNWTGGNGGAFANSGSLSTTYSPSPADIDDDSVVLYITSAGSLFGCPNVQDSTIIYFSESPAVAAGPDRVVCSSESLLTLAGSVGGPTTSGVWATSGSGSFSPEDTLLNADYLISNADTAAGSFTLTLTSTQNGNCLAVSDSIKITVVDKPLVNITSQDSICSSATTIPLTGTVTPGFTTNWNVLGAGSVASVGSLNTFYTLSPVDTNNAFIDVILETTGVSCPIEDDTLRITFVSPPKTFAGLDQTYCNNEPVQLNGVVSGNNSSSSWTSTGTGYFNPGPNLLSTLYFPSNDDIINGGLDLYLTTNAAFGCPEDKDTLTVTFKESPISAFQFDAACVGENTQFTDLSTSSDGTIDSWLYYFGDGDSSIANLPLHNYPAQGNYNVSLIITSTNGCSDTLFLSVTVNPGPVPLFTYGNSCVNAETQFTDGSFISSGSIVDWEYSFENGISISNDQNPIHVFENSGGFSVDLTVTSDLGCSSTLSTSVPVLPGPTAAFSVTPNPALALEDVYFTDLTTGDPITDWFWDFGDGEGGNNQNEIHDYSDGGEYEIILEVIDENGCIDTVARTITVALIPVVPTAFTPNGDGENDVFLIRGGPFSAVDFKVYSNWGELLFHSNDALIGWDGKFNGSPATIGVYTWTFEVQMAGNRTFIKSGDVNLIR